MGFLFWLNDHFLSIYAGLFGAIFASFACVVAERVPKGVSINGRSQCVCGRTLKARENIPILGWLLSGGKARCCGARIPAHYFGAEVAGFIGWLSLVELLGGYLGFAISAIVTAIVTYYFTSKNTKALKRASS